MHIMMSARSNYQHLGSSSQHRRAGAIRQVKFARALLCLRTKQSTGDGSFQLVMSFESTRSALEVLTATASKCIGRPLFPTLDPSLEYVTAPPPCTMR